MKRNVVLPLFVIAVLVFAQLACGSSNSGEKVGEKSSATNTPVKVQVYKIGDIVKVKDHTIVLNSAEVTNGVIKANFTLENTGSKDLAVSSLISFTAKADDGTKLDQEIMNCGSSFGGTVLAGDKLKGDICWSGLTTDKAKIYYEADLFGTGAVVWEISK